ncbi:MAG: hypothetical protein WA951_05850 [Leeuwenhoekiella sp.]
MKQSLILFVLMIVFKPVFPVLEYVVDYDYISTVLCINKDKPELNCNGKCYLMQSLAEAAKEEADQKKENLLKKVDVPLLFVVQAEASSAVTADATVRRSILTAPIFYSFENTFDFLHPPIG